MLFIPVFQTEKSRQAIILSSLKENLCFSEKTTGIKERRVASDHITCSDLCFKAANNLLSELHVLKDEIEVLIFVSQSPDYFLPATAVTLQERLGLSKNCMSFDINLGCSGYVYGLSVISSLLQSGLKKACC